MQLQVYEGRSGRMIPCVEESYQVGEEALLELHTSVPLRSILWQGQSLSPTPLEAHGQRQPYGYAKSPRLWVLQMTDQVGKLELCLEGDQVRHDLTLYVYPSKLSGNPQRAWELLRHICARIPQFTEQLAFPLELRQEIDRRAGVLGPPPDTVVLGNHFAPRLFEITQNILGAPETRSLAKIQLERGGNFSGVVRWEATFDHWASSGQPGLEHYSQSTTRQWDTELHRLLLHFWAELLHQAREQNDLELSHRLQRQHHRVLMAFPGVQPYTDTLELRPRQGAYYALLELWREFKTVRKPQIWGLPQGTLGMAFLYEVWVACEIAELLGCSAQGELLEQEGQLACQFVGQDFVIDYNIPVRFGGVYAHTSQEFGARPDLFIRSSDPEERIKMVLEVKYRNLSKLDPSALGAITRQVRAYMGDLQAPLGLVIWPGSTEQHHFELENRGPRRGSWGSLPLRPGESAHYLRHQLQTALEAVGMGM